MTVTLDSLLQAPAEQRSADASPPSAPAAGGGDAPGRHRDLLIVAGLLVVAGVVLGLGATGFPSYADDEGTYLAQAWATRTTGALSHYTYWYDHPPLGWVQLAVLQLVVGPLTGAALTVAQGRLLMLVPALASVALVYVLGRRLGLRRPFAAVGGLLLALSPLAVTSLRQVYLDNVATPWLLAAFVLAAPRRRGLWSYAASGACFAVAVLSKETSVLLLPALAVLIAQTADRRTRAFCTAGFTSALVLLGLAYPLYALLKGELLPGPGHVSLVEALRFQLFSRTSTGSALDPTSASAALVDSWLRLDPWLLGGGVLLAPLALLVRRLRPVSVAVLVLTVVGLRPGYLPQPYVIALLPFATLTVAGLFDTAVGRLPRRAGAAMVRPGVVLAGAAVLVGLVAPAWYAGDRQAMTTDTTAAQRAAERYLTTTVDPRARLLVDDTYYVDLVRAGFRPQLGVVWFYKLDFTTNLDPSIVRALPRGWRQFDYIVSSPVIRSALAHNPGQLEEVRLALDNSTPVATFGSGDVRVEVRRIVGPGTGSGLIPAAGRAR